MFFFLKNYFNVLRTFKIQYNSCLTHSCRIDYQKLMLFNQKIINLLLPDAF
jgi:hypothetical protein